MKNKFVLGCTLGLILAANLAYAEMDPSYVQQVLKDNNGWPLATVCTASDVNVRTEANTNCDVITMLQKGDIFYVKEIIPKADYTWYRGVTARGENGYMVSKYLDQAPRAATRNERFRAAFITSTIYNSENLAKAMGITFHYKPELVESLQQEVFHYASHRYKVGNNWVHGEKNSDGSFDTIGVVIASPGYKVAGLEVGQNITKAEILSFNKSMNMIGWDSPYDNLDEAKEVYWYLYDTVDGQQRPVESFGLILENNIIREIKYSHIVID